MEKRSIEKEGIFLGEKADKKEDNRFLYSRFPPPPPAAAASNTSATAVDLWTLDDDKERAFGLEPPGISSIAILGVLFFYLSFLPSSNCFMVH